MLRTRLATAAVALPTLVWLIFFGPVWLFGAIVLAVTAVGLFEFVTMAHPQSRSAQAYSITVGMLVACAVVSGRAEALGLVLVLAVCVGLVLALADSDMVGAVNRLAHGLLAALYAGLLLPHVFSLHALPESGPRWVFFVITCAMAADSAGYFGGRAFGRTKLFPRVSPNKTVEGALSGLLGSLVGAVLVAWLLPPGGLGIGAAIWLGLAIGILSQVGDLIESMFKRVYEAKDSGWILPGHGGVLDRTDSLVLPFVFAYYWSAGVGA